MRGETKLKKILLKEKMEDYEITSMKRQSYDNEVIQVVLKNQKNESLCFILNREKKLAGISCNIADAKTQTNHYYKFEKFSGKKYQTDLLEASEKLWTKCQEHFKLRIKLLLM